MFSLNNFILLYLGNKYIYYKMKQSLLSIAGLVCCAAFAQSIGKENYKKSLNGPVSSIRVITYKALDKGGGNYGKGEIEIRNGKFSDLL